MPGAAASSVAGGVAVVVGPGGPRLIGSTTVTVQFMPVVAPAGPGPTWLHWSTDRVAARADVDTSAKPPKASISVASAESRARAVLRGGREACAEVMGLPVR